MLLFDLGSFFSWLDYLTQLSYFFMCRLREKTTYRLAHVFYQHEGILDALVWLGSPKGAHCGHLVRLVRFHDGTDLRCYLTNVLDPRQLSLPDVARLYARSFDIELAILTLTELLHLQHWWSSQPLLIQQQAFAVLIIAQLLQAVRLLIAANAGRDPFEVSLPLLVKYVPQLIYQRLHPLAWMHISGSALGLLRPSSRRALQLPSLDLAQYLFAPPRPGPHAQSLLSRICRHPWSLLSCQKEVLSTGKQLFINDLVGANGRRRRPGWRPSCRP